MPTEPDAALQAITERLTQAEAELVELKRNAPHPRNKLSKRALGFLAVFTGLAIVAGVRLGMADSPPLAGEVVPRQIPYRGVLEQNGAPVTNAATPMRFALYGSATAAPPALWEEERSVAVVDGNFSVDLGDLTPIPSSVLQLPALYLEIAVNGQTLTGRQRLMSVPYAQRAAGAYSAAPGVPFVADSLQVSGTASVGAALMANSLQASSVRVTGDPDGGVALTTTSLQATGAATTDSLTVTSTLTAQSASLGTASLSGNLNLAADGKLCVGTTCFCPRRLVRCRWSLFGPVTWVDNESECAMWHQYYETSWTEYGGLSFDDSGSAGLAILTLMDCNWVPTNPNGGSNYYTSLADTQAHFGLIARTANGSTTLKPYP